MSDDYDVIIKNATIVDGTGGKPFKGEVALYGDRIAAVGEYQGSRWLR